MRFWDASAVVPFCVEESTSADVGGIFGHDPSMVVWWGTRTECISAFMRRLREGSLRSSDERAAYLVFQSLMQTWIEIQPSETVRSTAERLLTVHRLRSADAFQLAAAIEWRQGPTTGQSFVVFDQRLRDACRIEDFSVLPASF